MTRMPMRSCAQAPMRSVARLALAVLGCCIALASPASAATLPVNMQFSAFAPSDLDLLPGETVEWTNVSERRHTVNADDGSFASGDMFGGDRFERTFDQLGVFPYHCTVHEGMIGEVAVRRVSLAPLPPAPIPAGEKVEFSGRTADPLQQVRVERIEGSGFRTVATATPAADGSWKALVPAQTTGDYRAASGTDGSQTRRLLVSDRKVHVRATRRGIAVAVTPALPYARIVVQQQMRERFGWWPSIRARLDYVSRASFAIRRPAHVRVLLVDKDGWTPLVTSPVVVLGRPPRVPSAPHSPIHHG